MKKQWFKNPERGNYMDAFRSDGTRIYVEAEYLELLIPTDWFDESKKFAVDMGNSINLLGVCYVALYEKEGQPPTIKTMNVPTWIHVNVYETTVRRMLLPGSDDEEQVRVVKYYKGNDIMAARIIADTANAEKYLKMIMAGKLPGSISYNDSLSLWLRNQNMNDMVFDVPSVILEMLLATSYRDPNDLSKKFSTVYGKSADASPFAYRMINNRQISQYASTFTAMTFEDFDAMVTASVNRTRQHKEETISPLEKIIKM